MILTENEKMIKCQKCGYEWRTKINPKCCPQCKNYNPDTPKKKQTTKLEGELNDVNN